LCLDYDSTGTFFATAGKDLAVRIYDESTKQVVKVLKGDGFSLLGHNNRIFCVKFVDSNIILSGGWDTNVLFWDLRDGKPVRSFIGPKITGESIDFKEGKILTGASRGRG
jgi:COMPASS component SWD3